MEFKPDLGVDRDDLRGMLARIVAGVVPVALLLVLAAVFLYRQELNAELRVHEQLGRRIVDVLADLVERGLESAGGDLRYLSSHSALTDLLHDVPQARSRLETELVSFCRNKGIYDQIRVLDERGREIVRVRYDDGAFAAVPVSGLQDGARRDYFVRGIGLPVGTVYVSPLELNVEHGRIEWPLKPVVRLATPLIDAGRRRGVLVLNLLGARLLRSVRESSAAFPADVAVLDDRGFYLLHPRSFEAQWGRQLGHGASFAADRPAVWDSLAGRARGQMRQAQGLFTFRAVENEGTPEGGLWIVAHMPEERLERTATALLRRILLVYAVLSPVLLGLIVFLAWARTVRRGQERRIGESEARLRALSAQLLDAQERERSSISRDLHDDLGQLVTAIGLDLERAAQAGEPAVRDALVQQALRGNRALMRRVREFSTRLRPRMLDDLGLKEAARTFVAECEERLGLTPEAELRFEHERIPPEIAVNLFRILQEATSNVARHSQSAAVSISLVVGEALAELTVSDRGVGFDPRAVRGRGLGLLSMQERVELLGGVFRLRTAPGRGTTVQVSIPLAAEARS